MSLYDPSELLDLMAAVACDDWLGLTRWISEIPARQEKWRSGQRAVIAALAEAGYVIVPREPTEGMLQAATMQIPTWDDDASRRKWDAMVDAALGNSQ